MGKMIKKHELMMLGVSTAFLLYIIYIVFPFADAYEFFSAANPPQEDKVSTYFIMTTVVFAVYLLYVFFAYKKVKFLNSLIYPLVLSVLFLGTFTSLMVFGGAILWLAMFLFPLFIVVLAGSFIVGILYDIKYYKLIKGEGNL